MQERGVEAVSLFKNTSLILENLDSEVEHLPRMQERPWVWFPELQDKSKNTKT